MSSAKRPAAPPVPSGKMIEKMIQGISILVVDDNPYMRRVTRMMLVNLGAKSVIEAADGLGALEAIRTRDPDIMLLDWDMPVLNGIEVLRIVRSPGVFPRPNLPTIMLTNRAHRGQVAEAMRAGAHEFLVKPTSPKALRDRLTSIVVNPRPMVKIGKYYVPRPRRVRAKTRAASRLPAATAS
jgi:two-component system, chemotaxis family, chemotaxis protein CheY